MGVEDDKQASTRPLGLDSVQIQTVPGDTLRFGYLSNAINYCTSNPIERKFPHLISPGHKLQRKTGMAHSAPHFWGYRTF